MFRFVIRLFLVLPFGLCAEPVINEFLAINNNTIADEDGDFPDWIEIHNSGTAPLQLEGYFLTDNPTNLTKWIFPEHELCAECFLLVFASEKNRAEAGEELHTNFKLTSDGEYLALVAPDGTNIVQEFTPRYPPQFDDVSYGRPSGLSNDTLVAPGAAGKVLIPANPTNETNWYTVGFDDANWTAIETGIGFELNANAPWTPVASMGNGITPNEFSGVQGQDHWYYGYLDVGVDGDDSNYMATPGGTDEMTLFPGGADVPGAHSGSDYWTGTNWDWFQGNPPWTVISSAIMHPSDSNPGAEHYTILRYVVEPEVVGEIRIMGSVENPSANGDGTTGRIFHNGVELYAAVTDANVQTFDVIRAVQAGDFIDLMIDTGPANDDGSDSTRYAIEIFDRPQLADLIANNGDLETAMHTVNPGAWLRLPFVLSSVNDIRHLTLHMQFNDGFAAYVNGLEAVVTNAISGASYNQAATTSRSLVDSQAVEVFNLDAVIDALQIGTNILAIHGMNTSASDDTFLILPELQTVRELSTASTNDQYFSTPTPADENISGVAVIGPLIRDATDEIAAITNTASGLIVTARVQQTREPFAELRVLHRILYDAEISLVMVDNGANGDLASGDGWFTATIPLIGLDPGEMLRWRYEAEDSQGTLSRLPEFADPLDRDEYYGTIRVDGSIESHLPVIHWFTTDPAGANARTGSRGSMFYEGEFYDNILFDLHGQSTQNFPKKSYDIDFNRDHRFRWRDGEKRVRDVNLLTNWADKSKMRNSLAYEAQRLAGAPYHFALPVRVQQNGSFLAISDLVEDGDDRLLERNDLDEKGAFYKMYNTLNSSTSGVEKKTRKEEGNSDLQELVAGINTAANIDRIHYLYDHVDLPATVNYYVMQSLIHNRDFGHKNYYLYRDTEGTGEWMPISWDVDLSFGHNFDGGQGYFDDRMLWENPLNVNLNNNLARTIYNNPEFNQMVLRRLRTIMDTIIEPPGTPDGQSVLITRIQALADQIDPPSIVISDAELDFNKWGSWGDGWAMRPSIDRLINGHLRKRRNWLFVTNAVSMGGTIPLEQAAGLQVEVAAVDFKPSSGDQNQEYIQLTHTNDVAIDISGWMITGAVEHVFMPGTVLRAHDAGMPDRSSLYLTPDAPSFRARSVSPTGNENRYVQGAYKGQLSARGETIYLLDTLTNQVTSFTYQGDPGELQNSLRITELNYAPADPTPVEHQSLPDLDAEDFEFIELVNLDFLPIDLSQARFVEGISFTFPSNSILEGFERILVVENLAAFTLRYGEGYRIAGQYTGNLNNGGEKIRLQDAVGENILSFEYDNAWLPSTDGLGRSLTIRDQQADYTSWGSSNSWRVSVVDGGTPGWDDRTLVDEDFDQLPDAWETFWFGGTNGSFEAQSDEDLMSDGEEYILGMSPIDKDAPYTISMELVGSNSVVSLPTMAAGGIGYTNLVRVYSLETTDELDGIWQDVPGRTDVIGRGQMINHTNDTGAVRFYRGRVSLRME